MRIDIHSHFICLDFIKHLQGRDSLPVSAFEHGTYVTTCCLGFRIPAVPRFVDMEVKLRDMEEMKVDVSVLSHVQPGSEVLASNEADYWASRINDHLAGIIEKYPSKFLGWGCLGFGSTERTIKEIDRCITELGFAGILLYSNINGKALDSPEFRPVYKHIARLGVPISCTDHTLEPGRDGQGLPNLGPWVHVRYQPQYRPPYSERAVRRTA